MADSSQLFQNNFFIKLLFTESILPALVRVEKNRGFGRRKQFHKEEKKDRVNN